MSKTTRMTPIRSVFILSQMMFAERIDIDLFDDDHILAFFVKDCITDNIPNGLFVAFCEKD